MEFIFFLSSAGVSPFLVTSESKFSTIILRKPFSESLKKDPKFKGMFRPGTAPVHHVYSRMLFVSLKKAHVFKQHVFLLALCAQQNFLAFLIDVFFKFRHLSHLFFQTDFLNLTIFLGVFLIFFDEKYCPNYYYNINQVLKQVLAWKTL